jgi:hypothetical protein
MTRTSVRSLEPGDSQSVLKSARQAPVRHSAAARPADTKRDTPLKDRQALMQLKTIMGARHHRVVEGEEDVIGERNSEHVVPLFPLDPGITPDRAEDRAGEAQHHDEQAPEHEHDVGRFDRHGHSQGRRDADNRYNKP